MSQLLLLALATFGSEDLTCIAAGVLIAQGRLGFVPGVGACLAGIFAGDLLLYFAGRFAGRPLVRCSLLRKALSQEKLDRASQWLAARGVIVVILSRFTPGLRLPTYVAAGLLRTRFWSFAWYFLLAAAVWTPLLVGATVLLGDGILRAVFAHKSNGLLAFSAIFAGTALLQWLPRYLARRPARRKQLAHAAAVAMLAFALVAAAKKALVIGIFAAALAFPALPPSAASWRVQRKLAGWWKRKVQWEFWPIWAAYLPLIPWFLFLAARHRSLTVFTAANPGIPTGGLAGESKSAILSQLAGAAPFRLIPSTFSLNQRIEAALAFQKDQGQEFPVVLKPDVGERGSGVAIIRSQSELESYLRATHAGTIIQKYIEGPEFGVFYYRYPGEQQGRIFSITQKFFPEVTGDGRTSVHDLILRDPRAVCLADAYLSRCRRSPSDVPPAGERIPLVDIGSHCRGAVFRNAAHLETERLRRAIDRVAKTHPGFYFGRFDLRSPSIAHLQAGCFHVLELNGVASEATHVYDPSVGIIQAYRTMFTQWRIAFEIGARNRAAGARPLLPGQLARLCRSRG